jgi:hypothetical protein
MTKSNIKYRVSLTSEEQTDLKRLIKAGRTAGYRIRHAHILLALDEIPENAVEPKVRWTDKKIAAAYDTHQRTIGNHRTRFVEEGANPRSLLHFDQRDRLKETTMVKQGHEHTICKYRP